jgi:hypothetical protein
VEVWALVILFFLRDEGVNNREPIFDSRGKTTPLVVVELVSSCVLFYIRRLKSKVVASKKRIRNLKAMLLRVKTAIESIESIESSTDSGGIEFRIPTYWWNES